MISVQVRMPENIVANIDKWIREGLFKSRSDAVKTILAFYEEREKTRRFYEMLMKNSKDAKEKPELLVPLDDV